MQVTYDMGLIKVILGDNGGRFPYCNTLLIDDSIKAVIDPGAGLTKLQLLNEEKDIAFVFNTHTHFDHISFNYVFDHSRIMANELESIFYQDRNEFLKAFEISESLGEAWSKEWQKRILRPDSPQTLYTPAFRHEWHLSLARLDGTYRWGDCIDFGRVNMEIVAAPGHSPGFSVMFFPQEGIVYCGDIDLTNFGPSCRNSELFIESAYKIADLDADVFITSHETGIVSKAEFVSRLDQYLDVISQRDHKLLNALDKPMSLAEIAHKGTFYGPKILADEFVYYWEWTMVKEHLRRLINQSLVGMEQGYYVRY